MKDSFSDALIAFLDKENIKYERIECFETGPHVPTPSVFFEFTSKNPNHQYILNELAKFNVKVVEKDGYTAKDINNAKYLELYPKGIFEFVNAICKRQIRVVEKDGKKAICNAHYEQAEPIILAKKPNENGGTALWHTINGFLLVNKHVRKLVEDHNLTGMVFNDVYVGARKKEKSDYIFQVTVSEPIGAECMPKDFGSRQGERDIYYCPICNEVVFCFNPFRFQLRFDRNKINLTKDLYITKEMFTQSDRDYFERHWDPTYAIVIISQRFYQLLKENKLLKGVRVFPICED